jgi:DNA replication and repair protein RecF
MNQRNAEIILRWTCFENDTLAIYNEQLVVSRYIFEKKKKFIEQFRPYFNSHHHAITGSEETVQLVYESHLFEKTLLPLYKR